MSNEISIEQLEKMFEHIKQNTSWDLSQPMAWRYFFLHHEPKKLEEASLKLEQDGYDIIGIFKAPKKRLTHQDVFILNIGKTEIHDVNSLNKRNHELSLFAQKEAIDSYDGMEIGQN